MGILPLVRRWSSLLKAHEVLHLQERIRTEAALAAAYRATAGRCRDDELRRFVENEARICHQNIERLMGFLTRT